MPDYGNLDGVLAWIQANMPDLYPSESRIAGWQDEITNGTGRGRDHDQIRDDIVEYIIGPALLEMGYDQETVDALILGKNEGGMNLSDFDMSDAGLPDDAIAPEGQGDVPGVLSGGQTYRIQREGQEDYYAQMYEWPAGSGQYMAFQYDSLDAMRAAVGDVALRTMSENQFSQVAQMAGNAAELVGDTGSFNLMMEDIMREVAADAGISDPTILGDYLGNPQIQQLMAQLTIGAITEAQFTAQLRQTEYYTDVLYPGIEAFYGRTDDPEGAYAMYRQNVSASLEQLGVPRDADGTYKSTIGLMLDAGVTDTEFADFAPTYLKAAGNDVYRQNLNQWVTAAGLDPIEDFESFFDVMAGTTTPELAEVVELAGLSYAAESAGSDITTDLFKELANRTDLTDQGAAALFTDLERSLIAMGDAGLADYGLSTRDVLLNKAGVATGGRSIAQTNNLIAKIAQERGMADDPTASFYTEYNREGAPYKAGLRSTVAEGA